MARWLAPTSESRVERIAIDAVHDRPWWPGTDVDGATLAALRASIASRGIIEPLLLRRRGADSFEVVCGSRRLRAARDLGQTHIPAIVRELRSGRRCSSRPGPPWSAGSTRGSHRAQRAPARRRVHAGRDPRARRPANARAGAGRGAVERSRVRASARALSRPRRFAADIAFDLPRAEVLPQMAPEALTAALAALDGVSLVALVR